LSKKRLKKNKNKIIVAYATCKVDWLGHIPAQSVKTVRPRVQNPHNGVGTHMFRKSSTRVKAPNLQLDTRTGGVNP
jgi:hypothetical protein